MQSFQSQQMYEGVSNPRMEMQTVRENKEGPPLQTRSLGTYYIATLIEAVQEWKLTSETKQKVQK